MADTADARNAMGAKDADDATKTATSREPDIRAAEVRAEMSCRAMAASSGRR
ncbi:hypothetical protein [Streptomyces sp. MST-110588]|uniref:hypothetical protein n=1 Tax=Streptomyces sp. MST-110588 TaxID=2833628 RepID=UPI001F5C8EB2|nr:hypothetical protein [Streptomyces sp. MST-110588]UNO39622.1 hypothetical protein KGS77_08405 [Streptomyces sp. MST-110588]